MNAPKGDRTNELLADRALLGMTEDEAVELAALLDGHDDSSFDEAAAAVHVATLGPRAALPAHLAAKIEQDAHAAFPETRHASFLRNLPANRVADPFRYAGWFAAAACLALAISSWVTRPSPVAVAPPAPPRQFEPPTPPVPPRVEPPKPPSAAILREKLMASANTVKVEWTATKDPGAKGAAGDVVWNEAEQRGYMRFHGLAANDPKKTQYQLWIFDASQDKKTPIDGGVFDVDPSSGDVFVAINPKLHVDKASLFAVTVEKPGGVVVSKREHIVVVAPVKV